MDKVFEGDAPGRPSVAGDQAAAILLLLLDECDAAAVLQHLDPDEIKSLGKAMFAAANTTDTQINAALSCFEDRRSALSEFATGVEPKVRTVMAQALGNVRADNVLAAIAPRTSEAVLDLVRWMERPVIARILAEEHPQVGAIILSVLTPEVAAAALEGLDDLVQADLIYRAAKLSTVPANALEELQELLGRYADTNNAVAMLKLGGKSDVAKIVNCLKKPTSARILKSVKKLNKALGEQIEEEMFTFDNLSALDGQALGLILRSVDAAVLGLALRGADEPLIDKLLGSLSARAAMSVRDDMADRGPVKREEVEEAQKQIVAIVRRLAEDNQIMIGGQGEDYV
jgi:flagellar motor switch protein FliG